MTFNTGLFGIDIDFLDPRPTVAWAECDVDLMGQPIVCFHHVVADGFGKDTYGWSGNLFLRADYPASRLDLLVEIDGEWISEASFDISDVLDFLIGAAQESDPQALLPVLLDVARSRARVFSLTAEDVARVDGLPLIADSSVEEELARRGSWAPGTLPGR